ncbi:hypothetical protein L211DRAFT_834661 [Terfezia boudieri ATCC MYA-4762]|uniref:Uncharacterized protein n=1 Tax=Terfezia boudieri ATCC MYA-4762 TaxID=1051890 RepID=A0A3N4LW25_9PEZI|nr:hypothetical protein L211DRAFT_834661 [Terfezia boudieri ATCC MYA-4762]
MTYNPDILIPQSLKGKLIACIRPLEDVPESLFKTWILFIHLYIPWSLARHASRPINPSYHASRT